MPPSTVWAWPVTNEAAVEGRAVVPTMVNFNYKRRIVEVYLNLAEFGPGVFGVAAAAKYHFGTTPDKLSARQAAALAGSARPI